MTPRPGTALLEAITAVLAGGVACAALAALLQAGDRLAAARRTRLDRLETIRIASAVLRRELVPADPASDLAGAGGDSVALRLFRGLAVVCARAATGDAAVVYEGEREPDPARDSVLPLAPAGAAPLPLRAALRTRGACAAACSGALAADPLAASEYTFQLGAPVPAGLPLLVFQHGTYALAGAALRVRHGAEGRQPLTAELLDDRPTRLVVRAEPDPAGARVDVLLAFQAPAPSARLRLPLPNTAPPDSGKERP